jgi:alkylation response protein AidB-like acyl-CoA dehydrogenase
MDFEPTDEQAALQAELRRFLTDRVTSEARRAAAERPGAVDRELWRELAGLGVFALTLPEAAGGVGLGLADATLVFEELGRAAAPGPLVGTFLAAGLAAGGVDALSGAAAGDVVVGLVPEPPAGGPAYVEYGAGLDALLIVGDGGVTLTGPPAGGTALDRPLDPLTPVTRVAALPAGETVGGPEAAHRLRTASALLAAALQVGLAAAALDLGTAHALGREQFGRPIGSFQAIKHLLADTAVAVEVARAAVQAAGVELDDAGDGGSPAAQRAVDAARIVASRAADRATRTCIQVHGGMGFTWDLDAHLLLKRALVLDVGLGSASASLDALAAAL